MKPAQAYSQTAVRRIESDFVQELTDVLAVEEPLEIRVGFADGTHRAISITMRTPGEDAELAAGFLFTEGILSSAEQIKQIRHCGPRTQQASAASSNTLRVDLEDDVAIDLKRLERHFYTTSSCGVCGKSSIEALHTGAKKLNPKGAPPIKAELFYQLSESLLSAQHAFEKTGGLHASVIFDRDGQIDTVCEDVGRHNALDKVIGRKFLAGEMPLKNKILMVSGRASFELVQKALMAGIPIMAAVGAPSSLAVELAKEFNMTLIGFVREKRFNIYTGRERISDIDSPSTFVKTDPRGGT